MDCLGPIFRFPWAKYRYKNLRQTMRDHGASVCLATNRKVDVESTQFVLSTSIGSVAAIVENLDTRRLQLQLESQCNRKAVLFTMVVYVQEFERENIRKTVIFASLGA